MTPASGSTQLPSPMPPTGAARYTAPVDLPRKAQIRLTERIDLIRNKHKPLSILRAEAKRVLDQFLDQEGTAASLSRSDRDRIVEDLIASSTGFGPLEEVFRDEATKEILILNSSQVIGRRNDNWSPTSARFRDDDQVRVVLQNWANLGESYVPGPQAVGGYDLRLPNGFRVLAVLPPIVMTMVPQVLLIRGAPPVTAAVVASAGIGMGGSAVAGMSGIYRPPGMSGISATPAPRQGIPAATSTAGQGADKPESGVITLGAPQTRGNGPNSSVGSFSAASHSSTSLAGSLSSASLAGSMSSTSMTDPSVRIRQKVTQRIITKLAAAGVYDLNVIPQPELHRVILSQVMEYCIQEKLNGDDAMYNRLTLEILAGMNR